MVDGLMRSAATHAGGSQVMTEDVWSAVASSVRRAVGGCRSGPACHPASYSAPFAPVIARLKGLQRAPSLQS